MKSSFRAIAAGTVIAMICVTVAQAREPIRADLPSPYGPGGPADPSEWSLSGSGTPTLPANSGVSEPFNYELKSGSSITTDDFDFQNPVLAFQSLQDVGYSSALPSSTGPLTQILEYKLAGGYLGDTEFEFNYDSSLTSTTVGTASLTFGGVNYKSSGTTLPLANADSDNFVFNSAGKYIGSFVDASGVLSNTGGSAPIGWTSSGGGGTVSAPEIDPSSAIAALTLFAGGLVMLRSGRRSPKTIR